MSPRLLRRRKQLTILQANVGRGAAAHEIALNSAFEDKVDILLVQEPYIFRDLSRRISKKHRAYECFSPLDDWTSARPRVLTYIRKGAGIDAEQARPHDVDPPALSDILFLFVSSADSPTFLIANVYNAPPGSQGAGAAVQALLSLPQSFFPNFSFLAGDFNLHHERWQPSYQSGNAALANLFVEWLDSLTLVLISEIDTPTHSGGNVLDLAFVSGHLAARGASTATDPDRANTSDHLPLVTSLPWKPPATNTAQRLRLNTLDEDLFRTLLSAGVGGIPTAPPESEADLDALANSLTSALRNALEGAAKRGLGQGTGQQWWNDDCKNAAANYRQARKEDLNGSRTHVAQKELRRVVRKAQRGFWRDKIDKATKSKDVFDMTKWHKSTGTFRMPP